MVHDTSTLVKHLERSVILAELGISTLRTDIYFIDGMSSPKCRRLLNELCKLTPCNYLEIGCWKGSTLVSALYGNEYKINKAVAIDNFGEFQKPLFTNSLNFDNSPIRRPDIELSTASVSSQLAANITKYLAMPCWCFDLPKNNDKLIFHDNDCFEEGFVQKLEQEYTNFFNIYFYDGNHDEESQYKAFKMYDKMMADSFIAVVDDWNDGNAQVGTERAFKELNYNVVYGGELPAKFNGDVFEWWNGLGVFVLEKSK